MAVLPVPGGGIKLPLMSDEMNDLTATCVVPVAIEAAGYEGNRPACLCRLWGATGRGLRGSGNGAQAKNPEKQRKRSDLMPQCRHLSTFLHLDPDDVAVDVCAISRVRSGRSSL